MEQILEHSFIFLDRVSAIAERRLWHQGIRTWDDFRTAKKLAGFSDRRKRFSERQIELCRRALVEQDLPALTTYLPRSEQWRLFPLFCGRACYLDIETAQRYGDITVLGAWDGREYASFVKGCNLEKGLVHEYLGRFQLFVTFNGSSFDIPIIERFFGGVLPEHYVHVDLRHVFSRLGYVGGLKSIELQLGIRRRDELEGMDGSHAAMLWWEYLLTREDELVETLLAYNEADCRNLEPLANFAIESLWQRITPRTPRRQSSRANAPLARTM